MPLRWKLALAYFGGVIAAFAAIVGTIVGIYRISGNQPLAVSGALLLVSAVIFGGAGYQTGKQRENNSKRGEP